MTPDRLKQLTGRYPALRIVIVGDFCLDRYFDIDPARAEISLETGLAVHNLTGVRCQPGGAGTILNNLSALGVGTLFPVGVSGDDGEGWELRRALQQRRGVDLAHFQVSAGRHTFTYSKPLVHRAGTPPEELNRLDLKNWTPTPEALQAAIAQATRAAIEQADGVILLDQVDQPETGVITSPVLEAIREIVAERPDLVILGDSRRSLRSWPPVIFKMNSRELGLLVGKPVDSVAEVRDACAAFARANGRRAFVTMAERGIIGADADGTVYEVPALPVRGPIDVVGAGDSVTANLTAALCAGASLTEAMEMAMAAAGHVVHQLGTTGTANIEDLARLLH